MSSLMPKIIAREGYPFLLIGLGISTVLFLVFGVAAGLGSLVLPLFVAFFFRNPERTPPQDDSIAVSPADGKVISIVEVEEGRHLKRRMRRVTIFLSIFNVHINRVPMNGRIKEVKYHPGRFLMGFAEKASLENEQNAVLMTSRKGTEILFVQIAGFVARRIVCYLKGGEEVACGERFGLIRFGSRMDVYLPLDAEVLVKYGQKVKGGETPFARLP